MEGEANVASGTGVLGQAFGGANSVGVVGRSDSGDGVDGAATSGTGVNAYSSTGYALLARSGSNVAVYARSDFSAIDAGTTGNLGSATGVYGHNDSTTIGGIGVAGRVFLATSYGVYGENVAGGWAGWLLWRREGHRHAIRGCVRSIRRQIEEGDSRRSLWPRPGREASSRDVSLDQEGTDNGVQLGLIAQDVQKVVPEVVRTGKSEHRLAGHQLYGSCAGANQDSSGTAEDHRATGGSAHPA